MMIWKKPITWKHTNFFLNDECNIHFKWAEGNEKKELKYQDLTGPEKVGLFTKINIPALFPSFPKKSTSKFMVHFL